VTERGWGIGLMSLIEEESNKTIARGGKAEVCILTPREYVALAKAVTSTSGFNRLLVMTSTGEVEILASANAKICRLVVGSKAHLL
jgi:hypothetical protein